MTTRHWLGKFWGRTSRRPSLANPSRQRSRLAVEKLEDRYLLSFTPALVRHAYGFDRVAFLDSAHAQVAADGHGETIAIVDAYDDPNISSDLAVFDSRFGLPAPPSFRKVNQTGGTTYPPPNQTWAGEIAIDVEYAHAMAPGAGILLVEANNNGSNNLDTAVQYAASQPGVVAVSMSYGAPEYPGETGRDSVFTHAGVTYLSASGDTGAPGSYQAFSPNVVAVGGTSLYLDGSRNYGSESGWSGSGISLYEAQPSYQHGVVTQSTTQRTIPDISFVADPLTGVDIVDSYGGTPEGAGTSLSCPLMAGLTAVVDQGRSYLNGLSSYNGQDFLNALYHLPDNAVHDIVTGNNGFPAGPGYDLVTGRGTPIVQRFVAGMTGDPVLDPTTGNLLIVGGGRLSSDTLTLDTSASQLTVSFHLSAPVPGNGRGGSYTLSYPSGSVHAIEIVTHGEGDDPMSAVDIYRTPAGVPTTVRTAGYDSVTLGTGSVQGILGPVTVDPLAYSATLTVDDSGDSASHSAITLSDAGSGFGQITGLAPSTISYRSAATSAVTVQTGNGSNTVNVQATTRALDIVSSGHTDVALGNNNSLAGITGAVSVTVAGSGSYQVEVNDGADNANHPNVVLSATSLTGLAPAPINFGTGSVSTLTVTVGNGANTYTIAGTPGTVSNTLATGSGRNTVTVTGTNHPMTLTGNPAGINILVGPAGTTTWHITGANAGNLSAGTMVSFTGYESLTGSNGDNIFSFSDGASLSGNLTGGSSGNNTLDLSASTANLAVNINGTDAGNVAGVLGAFRSIQNVIGGSGSNSFVFFTGALLDGNLYGGISSGSNGLVLAPLTANLRVNITGTDAGNVAGVVRSFAQISNVLGSNTGNNTFVFSDGARLDGILFGNVPGSNTLDTSAYSTAESFTITGSYTGTGTPVGQFFYIQNLVGAGAGGSYFQFADGARLDGNLAGGGRATLDYSPYTTSVVVDLQPSVARATGVGGTISGITSVIGASGAPGTAGLYNLLIGSDVGGDTLQGGTGRRNLLVAGGGASTLIGGDGEDLLIGGTTAYDTDPALANWLAIANYWAGTDDFATRSANLQSGNGVPLLDATTVTGNGGGNTMRGNGGTALIYTDGQDSIDNVFGSTSLVTIAP